MLHGEDGPLIKTLTNPVGMSPWSSKVVSKTKTTPLPRGEKKVPKLYHSPGVPVSSLGMSTNDKCIVPMISSRFSESTTELIEFLVSKETVVLRRWERSKQKFGFIKRVDKG